MEDECKEEPLSVEQQIESQKRKDTLVKVRPLIVVNAENWKGLTRENNVYNLYNDGDNKYKIFHIFKKLEYFDDDANIKGFYIIDPEDNIFTLWGTREEFNKINNE